MQYVQVITNIITIVVLIYLTTNSRLISNLFLSITNRLDIVAVRVNDAIRQRHTVIRDYRSIELIRVFQNATNDYITTIHFNKISGWTIHLTSHNATKEIVKIENVKSLRIALEESIRRLTSYDRIANFHN